VFSTIFFNILLTITISFARTDLFAASHIVFGHGCCFEVSVLPLAAFLTFFCFGELLIFMVYYRVNLNIDSIYAHFME